MSERQELAKERRDEGLYTEAEKAYSRNREKKRIKRKKNSSKLRELARLDLISNGTPIHERRAHAK